MTTRTHHDVVIVGGGVSGLVAGWKLRTAGVDVLVLEAEDAVGGCMRTDRKAGCLLEQGPFNIIVRDPAFHDLLEACDGDVTSVSASTESKARFILRGGRLLPVPTSPVSLLRTPLLSFGARLRLLRGMVISRRAREHEEATIAQAASRRLGPEVASTFVSALVAGIFGGDSSRLSLKACFPTIWKMDCEARSPIAFGISMMRARKKSAQGQRPRKRGLISFEGGLQSLVDWLADQIGEGMRTGSRVESVHRESQRYVVRTINAGDEIDYTCNQLVLATSKDVAGRLLAEMNEPVSHQLGAIPSASLVVLNIALDAKQVRHPMSGYGFLVPVDEPDVSVMGVLWADSAFPHHATPGTRLIRVFMGGPRDPNAAERSDGELIDAAMNSVRDLLGIEGEPTLIDVCRWPNSIPQYHLGHTEVVEQVERELEALPGLHLVGNYLHGVSINDCVREGSAMAERVRAAGAHMQTDCAAECTGRNGISGCSEIDGDGRPAHSAERMATGEKGMVR